MQFILLNKFYNHVNFIYHSETVPAKVCLRRSTRTRQSIDYDENSFGTIPNFDDLMDETDGGTDTLNGSNKISVENETLSESENGAPSMSESEQASEIGTSLPNENETNDGQSTVHSSGESINDYDVEFLAPSSASTSRSTSQQNDIQETESQKSNEVSSNNNNKPLVQLIIQIAHGLKAFTKKVDKLTTKFDQILAQNQAKSIHTTIERKLALQQKYSFLPFKTVDQLDSY